MGDSIWDSQGFIQDPSNKDYEDLELESTEWELQQVLDFTSTNDSSESSQKKLGRRINPETLFLNLFRTDRSLKAPKKENLRIQLYRGWLKLVERVHAGRAPTQRVNRRFDGDLDAYSAALESLTSWVLHSWGDLSPLLTTRKSPKMSGDRSFSDNFFKEVFTNETVSTCFRLYIDFVFADTSPVLIDRLRLRCCWSECGEHPSHTPECLYHWCKLRDYCKDQLFAIR